jgi:hypothetical protein
MRQLIIIYEFQQGNSLKKRPFEDMIRKYGSFAFLTDNSCIIWTEATAVMVRDNLMTGLGSGDKLYVGETYAPAAWTNSILKQVSDYVIKNLKGK